MNANFYVCRYQWLQTQPIPLETVGNETEYVDATSGGKWTQIPVLSLPPQTETEFP